MGGFCHHSRQQVPFRFPKAEDFVLKKIHSGGMAHKGNYHKVWGDDAVGSHRMELAGLVEDNVPLFQGMYLVLGGDNGLPFVYAEEFPEIMGFPGKYKVFSIFKIVYGDDLGDVK